MGRFSPSIVGIRLVVVTKIKGVIINELSKLLAEDTDDKTHSIIVDDLLNPNEPLVIMLALMGVSSYLPSSNPRISEY